jgi:hypothetical protein
MANPRLYEVTLTTVVYVMAENGAEACRIAKSHASDEEPDSHEATEITGMDGVPRAWRDSIPYGEEQDRTVRQILEVGNG